MKQNSMIVLVLFFLVFLYFFVMISPAMYWPKKVKIKKDKLKETVLTGHRGAGGLAPENTLAAIDTGMSYAVQRIEIDVRQTKDGVVVCIHDETINRTTNGTGKVKDFSYSELMSFDAGLWFAKEFEGQKIPTLEQVLARTKNKVVLLIEIKDGDKMYPGIEQNVVATIRKFNAKDWAIVHSFNDSVLFRINRIDPEIKLHKLLITSFPFLYLLYDGEFRITNLEHYHFVDEFSIFLPFATKSFIQKVHKTGKKVNVWTVNDKKKMARLIHLGADGIITDFPNLIAAKN
jgi:glycerophosphoryl diester phosphodiesterase